MSIAALLKALGGLLDAASIPYMVVGSVASTVYSEPRTTFDLDLVIAPTRETLDALLGTMPERFYVDPDTARDALRSRSMFNVIDQDTGWKADLIVRKTRPFSLEEFERRRRGTIDGIETFVASAEDTVISKLEWAKLGASSRQIDDVRKLLAMQPAIDRSYIERWIAELELAAQWAEANR
ncbi:MAG: hypothetical protein JNL83_34950 [Myxococcales bacterium]|nr:hypothetical protein [Myxococcales bacterium]